MKIVIHNTNLILVIIRVKSFNFAFSELESHANTFDSLFFFYFTLLKTENTWPTTQALGKITNMYKEQKNIRGKRDGSTMWGLFSFLQQIVLFLAPLFKYFTVKIFEVQGFCLIFL